VKIFVDNFLHIKFFVVIKKILKFFICFKYGMRNLWFGEILPRFPC